MSNITFGMVQMALGRGADMEISEDRAEVWRMWVTLERELEAERRRQSVDGRLRAAQVSRALDEMYAEAASAPAPAAPSPNLGAVLGALAGVMAASQAAKPKDEDDGA